jgi:toxin ParE1/3/4
MQDRTHIFDYIEVNNPRAAIAVDARIADRISHLSLFPNSGRLGRVRNTRELMITGTPYIAIYRLSNGQPFILRILHSAQNWPGTAT